VLLDSHDGEGGAGGGELLPPYGWEGALPAHLHKDRHNILLC
jgi:hypothetical protein